MRYWDSSAIVPLLVEQDASDAVQAEFALDSGMVVWWSADVECVSGIARLEREDAARSHDIPAAMAKLAALSASWQEVQPVTRIRVVAARLLRTHALRAVDALQLAAAIIASDGDSSTLTFVTLDRRLAIAADKEGFPVVVPA